jgi:hypothetical protein
MRMECVFAVRALVFVSCGVWLPTAPCAAAESHASCASIRPVPPSRAQVRLWPVPQSGASLPPHCLEISMQTCGPRHLLQREMRLEARAGDVMAGAGGAAGPAGKQTRIMSHAEARAGAFLPDMDAEEQKRFTLSELLTYKHANGIQVYTLIYKYE